MTNGEWLRSLSNEELAKFLVKAEARCQIICNSPACGVAYRCADGISMWLEADHKESEQ